MSPRSRTALIWMLVLVMIAGGCCICYPLFASWYTERHRSEVIVQHQQAVDGLDSSELKAARKAAADYNRRLAAREFLPEDYAVNGYHDLLNIVGDGIMGYIEIPKISVKLPIYHSTDNESLADGAGHMPQTSLPVGGSDTHAVITAHTGMPSSPMFTDLQQLEEGDLFFLMVLNQKLVYQVDQIVTVLPEDTSETQIQPELDLVTLLTCTPYGINSHRLLVRGCRIYPAENEIAEVTQRPQAKQSHWMQQYFFGILSGLWYALIPIGILSTILLIRKFTSRRKKENAEQR